MTSKPREFEKRAAKALAAKRAADAAGPAGDFDIRIARDGTWFHQGTAFKRLALVKLFSTVMRRDDNGDYLLVTPVERGRIVVEDAPFVAVEMVVDGSGREQVLRFRTNVDDWVVAGEGHPIRMAIDQETEEPSPYVLVRDGLEALITRPVFYDLVELGVEEWRDNNQMFGVWSAGRFFSFGNMMEWS